MPPALTVFLIATPVLLFGARAVLPGIPLRRYARASSRLDIALLIVGAVGLVLHCVAMFYRGLIAGIPGADGYLQAVNGMGTESIVLYVVPAVLVLAGLRRQQPVALIIIAVTLVAVGVTMYNGGALNVHLAAITAAAVALAAGTSLLVLRPRRSRKVSARG